MSDIWISIRAGIAIVLLLLLGCAPKAKFLQQEGRQLVYLRHAPCCVASLAELATIKEEPLTYDGTLGKHHVVEQWRKTVNGPDDCLCYMIPISEYTPKQPFEYGGARPAAPYDYQLIFPQ
jgi:hypothetical protein